MSTHYDPPPIFVRYGHAAGHEGYVVGNLGDKIYRGCTNDRAKRFQIEFTTAIDAGADLSCVGWKFMHWLLTDASINPGITHSSAALEIEKCVTIVGALANREPISWRAAVNAGYSASSVLGAARNIRSAWRGGKSVWSAAKRAAWIAIEGLDRRLMRRYLAFDRYGRYSEKTDSEVWADLCERSAELRSRWEFWVSDSAKHAAAITKHARNGVLKADSLKSADARELILLFGDAEYIASAAACAAKSAESIGARSGPRIDGWLIGWGDVDLVSAINGFYGIVLIGMFFGVRDNLVAVSSIAGWFAVVYIARVFAQSVWISPRIHAARDAREARAAAAKSAAYDRMADKLIDLLAAA